MKKKIANILLILFIAVSYVACGGGESSKPASDTTPPTIVNISPKDGVADVSLDPLVTVTFSEAIKDTLSIELTNGIVGQVSVDDSVATFVPDEPLSKDQTYSINISEVEDLAGNRMVDYAPISFSTITEVSPVPKPIPDPEPDPTPKASSQLTLEIRQPASDVITSSLNLDGVLCFNSSETDKDSITKGIVFTDTAGNDIAIQNVEFYKHSGTGNDCVSYDLPLSYSTSYTLTVSKDIQDAKGNTLMSKDSSGKLFNKDIQTSVKTTANPITLPKLLGMTPPNNAKDLPINTTFTISFNEPVDTSLVSDGVKLLVNNKAKNLIEGSFTIENGGKTHIFTLTNALKYDTSYIFRIKPELLIKINVDVDTDIVTHVTTIAPNDLFRLLRFYPNKWNANVSLESNVILIFSEEVEENVLTNSNIKLINRTTSVVPKYQLTKHGRTVVIDPELKLEPEQLYIVTLDGIVSQKTGRALYVQGGLEFTTGKDSNDGEPFLIDFSHSNTMVALKFDKPIHPELANDKTIYLTMGVKPIEGALHYLGDQVVFIPDEPLPAEMEFKMTILSQEKIFTTEVAPEPEKLTIPEKILPEPSARNSTFVFRFNHPLDPVTANISNIILLKKTALNKPDIVIDGLIQHNEDMVSYLPYSSLDSNSEYQFILYKDRILDMNENTLSYTHFNTFNTDATSDDIKPKVTNVEYKKNQSGDAKLNTSFTIHFNKAMNPVLINHNHIKFFKMDPTDPDKSEEMDIDITFAFDDPTFAIIQPKDMLEYAGSYKIAVSNNMMDLSDHNISPEYALSFSAMTPGAPVVESCYPGNGEGSVRDTMVVVAFDQEIDATTVDESSITLKNLTDDIIEKSTMQAMGKIVVIRPNALMTAPKQHEVVVGDKIKNKYGENFDPATFDQSLCYFHVVDIMDDTKPKAVNFLDSNEAPLASPVPVDGHFVVDFHTEYIDPLTVNANTLKLIVEKTGVQVETVYEYKGRSIEIKPVNPLDYSEQYQLVVETGLEDLSGNNLAAQSAKSFMTEDAP